ncbi:ABC-F family ATP-binding cassette domain-containing protein [Oceanobacillus luteolus]|uniref:ABC-F family ATP-binding cassette domain-containing protein n=1 Tax=Oceanobacillus luteolus TaxID=1274358 RepID=UPI00203F05BA|nr:ABC-F family ATP-binding cassette domain-containing protein [Oceanobacillus luteolus]MCM3741975.1 ABC-F family ATP-binding cassette domain-containing protein [Oceanobacillus luteolus]
MILMQINGLSKSFGSESILSNVKLEVKDLDRIAIVGRNGAGKSTLLKIMAGELSYDDGELIKPKELKIGYLSQQMKLESGKTIWNELVSVFAHLRKQEEDLRTIEAKLQDAHKLTEEENQELLAEYDKLQHAFQSGGGYTYESDIKAVLNGLNFSNFDYDTEISELSGGQKTRLALGKLLLQKPQLLFLDEPTNHLDIETLGWLESYLNSYPGAVVVVSHDRYFLDKTATIVYEVSRQRTKKYHGSYSKYLQQKALDYERELKEFEKQQTEIKRMEDFIQRNIARASTTKRAQSRRKQLEKMERMNRPLGDESSASFSFDIDRRSGNDVLTIENLALRYPNENDYTFENANLKLTRGERMVLIGPNGIGKSSLLKVITGRLQAAKGSFELGTNVTIGYYDQEQADLSSNKTVLQELWDEYPLVMEKDIRTILGNFLFSGDDVLKPVNQLSGGEKARLALAKLMMQKANLLILDEPTNHLDIDSKEVLEAALMDYPGTILFVSHDRYFINRITDQVAEMSQDGIKVYLGDYDYYLEKLEEEAELARLSEVKEQKPQTDEKRLSYKEEKQLRSEKRKKERRIAELETLIEEKELEIAALEEEMTKPEVFQNHEKALELTKQVEELQQQVNIHMEEWTNLQED